MKCFNGAAARVGFCGRTVDGQARQSVSVAMVTCLPVDNVILVSGAEGEHTAAGERLSWTADF